MTGLERIVDKIKDESAQRCENILKKADNDASALIAKARSDAGKKADEILTKAHEEADRIVAVAKSSGETVSKTKYLEVKNAVINDIISASYEKLLLLNDEDYFSLLFSLCVKYVETGECLMFLNSRDLKRLPKDFEDRINQTVYEKAAVQISKEPMDIENGFILDYGNFTVNCTLKSVFDDNKEKFRDLLSSRLFSNEN